MSDQAAAWLGLLGPIVFVVLVVGFVWWAASGKSLAELVARKPKPPRQLEYVEYESHVIDCLYNGRWGTCEFCGIEDTRLIHTGNKCVWCAELDNLRWHRWQQAARMGRGVRWMIEHDATNDFLKREVKA